MSKSGDITYRPMESSEWLRVAELIHNSTNSWYLAGKCTSPSGMPALCRFTKIWIRCCLIASVKTRQNCRFLFLSSTRHAYVSGYYEHQADFFQRNCKKLLTRIIDLAEKIHSQSGWYRAQNLDSYSCIPGRDFLRFRLFRICARKFPRTALV